MKFWLYGAVFRTNLSFLNFHICQVQGAVNLSKNTRSRQRDRIFNSVRTGIVGTECQKFQNDHGTSAKHLKGFIALFFITFKPLIPHDE